MIRKKERRGKAASPRPRLGKAVVVPPDPARPPTPPQKPRDPNNDGFYIRPRAWRDCKEKIFHCSTEAYAAAIDLERQSGAGVRTMLAVALVHFVRLPRRERSKALDYFFKRSRALSDRGNLFAYGAGIAAAMEKKAKGRQ